MLRFFYALSRTEFGALTQLSQHRFKVRMASLPKLINVVWWLFEEFL